MPRSHHLGIFLYNTRGVIDYFMGRKSVMEELEKLVSKCEASILYKPQKNEIDVHDNSFPLKMRANNLVLPNAKNSDPLMWADKCTDEFKNLNAYILIPGKQFDVRGTRHGKGGGWYDRFLSRIPPVWLRIGIADKSQVSMAELLKQEWDEPVDWLIVRDGFSWSIYNTRARRYSIYLNQSEKTPRN